LVQRGRGGRRGQGDRQRGSNEDTHAKTSP
jgi:hypothetical protein